MTIPSGILGVVPSTLESELFATFEEIERNYREHRWEPSELNGGKLCEVTYSILRGYVDNRFPASATKPSNMVDACRALEQVPSSFDRTIRIQIPRMLLALYEIRNNRGVGHVGGDIDPNMMDAICVLQMSKWIVSELIRFFNGITTEEASELVNAISEREIPLVWEVGDVRRILDTNLSALQKTLVLLYASAGPVGESELVKNIEHSNPSVYRRDVLRKAHKKKLLEYDALSKLVHISPLGMREVEDNILVSQSL